MGHLNLFSRSEPTLLRLPAGSFTIDRNGTVLSGTLASSFPQELVAEVARAILSAFREAESAQLPLSELVVDYPSLRISARELRGGAIVFLAPKTSGNPESRN
jgi:hypothetical protein